jgi:uncharacterized protein YcaQ
LLNIVMRLYAPLPAASLTYLCRLMRVGVPHLDLEIRQVQESASSRYAHAEVDGVQWFWPREERPDSIRYRVDDKLRFLAPFDPLVWDRRRFQLLWGWEYKFEAYVPVTMRRMGHYAMPMLWGEKMLGWGNFKVEKGRLKHELGFAGSRPRSREFQRALAEALQRLQVFLGR